MNDPQLDEQHVPDILDTIANLSSGIVFTSPKLANKMLDLLPPELWSDKSLRFLDPVAKTGVFLREIARRLMVGLESSFPDEAERRKHIFENMVFGYAVDEITGLMARRSLYYSKDASGPNSVHKFPSPDGNIQFTRLEHSYLRGRCRICGSPEGYLDRGDSLENFAYQFIHDKEIENMRFDVVVGNPPYQLEAAGHGAQATPIYQLFVEQAFRLKPRYVAMVTPSRWFAGGMGLDSFRKRMLDSTNFRHLVDYPDGAELFPGTQIKGGVSYFLWDKNYEGPCRVVRVQKNVEGPATERYLGEHGDIFIRFNEALPILEKVLKADLPSIEEQISAINPFGLATNFKDYEEAPSKGSVTLYSSNGIVYVDKSKIPMGLDMLDGWKVFTPKAGPGNDGYPHKILGDPIVAAPNSACTMTYIVAGIFATEEEAQNFAMYLKSKFARFMVALRKNTQDVSRSKFKWVPKLSMTKLWTDAELFEKFEINDVEKVFIDTIVREIV